MACIVYSNGRGDAGAAKSCFGCIQVGVQSLTGPRSPWHTERHIVRRVGPRGGERWIPI